MIKCPQCSYSLEGLPEEYVCPECGLEYDADMSIVRLKIHRWDWRQFIQTVAFIVFIAVGMRSLGAEAGDVEVIAVLGVLLVSSVLRVMRSASGDGTLVLDRNGVQLTHPRFQVQRFGWPEIKRAEYRWMIGSLVLVGYQKERLLSLRRHDVGGLAMARKCVGEINRLAKVYANRSADGARIS